MPEISKTGVYIDSKTGQVVESKPEEGVQLVPEGGELTAEVQRDIEAAKVAAEGGAPVEAVGVDKPEPAKAAKKA